MDGGRWGHLCSLRRNPILEKEEESDHGKRRRIRWGPWNDFLEAQGADCFRVGCDADGTDYVFPHPPVKLAVQVRDESSIRLPASLLLFGVICNAQCSLALIFWGRPVTLVN